MEDTIIFAAVEAFAAKGLKFTMDDIARMAGISKKTLYQLFESKEALCYRVVERCFAEIKAAERKIYDDPELTTMEKLRRILIVLPERYTNIGLSDLGMLKEKMPPVYQLLASHLENDWELTEDLLNRAAAEGSVRPVNLPIFKTMVQSTIQQFFASDVLAVNQISYEQGLAEMLSILIDGISLPSDS